MSNKNNTYKNTWKEILNAKKVLLHLHPSPDGDSAGSALALMLALEKIGKKVSVIKGDSEVPNYLTALPASEKILPHNFFQIDLSNFDLFIIVDSSSLTQISKMGEVTFPKTLKTISIDHHNTNDRFSDINIIKPTAPATCQIVYELLNTNKIEISKDIATCLMLGLYTDTGGFKYSSTSWKTLYIASKLAKINPEYHKIIFEIENNDSRDRLKLMSLLLGSISTHFDDKVAIASINYQDLLNNNINNQVLGNVDVSNMLKSVIEWDIGITFVEHQPSQVKVSFRTRNSEIFDLSKVAAATGNGGGHKAAAGATINKPFNEAKEFLLETIRATYPNLGQP